LEAKVALSQYPVVVAGDFNLVRGSADKNNSNIDWSRVSLFNDSIARMDLGEIRRTGARFTWSNKQANPVRSVLDRVLVSASWVGSFPLVSLCAETRIGSDHTPLILDSGDESPPQII
jgi:endonuclease/exonuclease/phosphatase family metal-dependent hydrolase